MEKLSSIDALPSGALLPTTTTIISGFTTQMPDVPNITYRVTSGQVAATQGASFIDRFDVDQLRVDVYSNTIYAKRPNRKEERLAKLDSLGTAAVELVKAQIWAFTIFYQQGSYALVRTLYVDKETNDVIADSGANRVNMVDSFVASASGVHTRTIH